MLIMHVVSSERAIAGGTAERNLVSFYPLTYPAELSTAYD
jgi:hypothetical protein